MRSRPADVDSDPDHDSGPSPVIRPGIAGPLPLSPAVERRAAWQSPQGLAVSASIVRSVGASCLTVDAPCAGLVIGIALDVRGRIISHAGEGRASAAGCEIRGGLGTLVAVDAGQPLLARYHDGALIRGASLFVPRSWVEREADGDEAFARLRETVPAQGIRQAALDGIALRAAAELIDSPFQGRMAALYAEARCYDLLLCAIDRFCGTARRADERAHPPISSGTRRRMLRAREILDARRDLPPSLPELALLAGSSVSVLRRSFAAVAGLPVAAYVRRGRLELARRQLAEGSTLQDAALTAGYSSVANFCTGFRREFGLTPGRARPARASAAGGPDAALTPARTAASAAR